MANIEAEYIVGPFVIGTCIELFLQGILSVQFVSYFATYRKAPPTRKVVVGILVLMTFAKSMQAFTVLWFHAVINFGDLNAVMKLKHQAWWSGSSGLAAATIALYVQSYFSLRFFKVSGKWYLAVPMYLLFVTGWVLAVLVYYDQFRGDHLQVEQWYHIYTMLALTGDTLLTSGIAYFVIKSRRKAILPKTAGILNSFIRLTFQTAAPATICTLLTLILAFDFPNVYPTSHSQSTSATNLALPKLYAFSMMWTLNAPHDIHSRFASHCDFPDPESNAQCDEDALTVPTLTVPTLSDFYSNSSGLREVSELATAQRSEKCTISACDSTGRRSMDAAESERPTSEVLTRDPVR
ncbi:hypothetical protein DFH07DRAFT_222651 [Mycena maculata]|uniref:DUF6534 domain-containing protein n=1 Tax=Mycena maculata TaxID=230809 RepID=A0AAD7MS65_9AGAR|nr:hypothetical protein DFH07DRAFT_222651 [Mycena maculata]